MSDLASMLLSREAFDVLKDVFVAEIGDKTMMVTLGLAEVFAIRLVLAGVTPACFVVPAVGVLIGIGLKGIIPIAALNYSCAVLFLGLAWWSIKEGQEDGEEDEEEKPLSEWFFIRAFQIFLRTLNQLTHWLKHKARHSGGWAVALAFTIFSIAEMADRTQLVTITKTVEGSNWVTDLVASGLGLLFANVAALIIFYFARSLLKRRVLMYAAATLFLLSAARIILQGWGYDPSWYLLASVFFALLATYPIGSRVFNFPTGPEKPKQIYA